MSIYESTFAASDKTNAILVVDKKKLHVNTVLLSCHSDYFKALFDSNIAKGEIKIKDVNFENFATLLSLVQPNPIVPTRDNAEKLLQLADQFQMPSAKRHVELFICSTKIKRIEKLKLADKYNLDVLLENTVNSYEKKEDFKGLYWMTSELSDRIRYNVFKRYFYLFEMNL